MCDKDNKNISIEKVIELLNKVLELDYDTMYRLIETRFIISNSLEKSDVNIIVNENNELGMLGFLNGLFYGSNQKIYAVYSDNGILLRFEK